jgi:hypothetical protein
MADDRKIIFSLHVTPMETDTMEEDGFSKTILLQQDTAGATVKKSFGGKGSVTDLADDQWNDGWTSMMHQDIKWEDLDDDDDDTGNRWEDSSDAWSGVSSISTSAHQLVQAVSSATDVDVSFLYIKNKGSVDLKVSLNGTSGNYYILVPASGSIALRGGDSSFHCDDVYVKTASSTTDIEWVLAKK